MSIASWQEQSTLDGSLAAQQAAHEVPLLAGFVGAFVEMEWGVEALLASWGLSWRWNGGSRLCTTRHSSYLVAPDEPARAAGLQVRLLLRVVEGADELRAGIVRRAAAAVERWSCDQVACASIICCALWRQAGEVQASGIRTRCKQAG